MPIYEESKHRWKNWFDEGKDLAPVWPAGLTKAAWDKAKAVLARGKKTGITEALTAAQKAFLEARKALGEYPAGTDEEAEESQKKAATYWKSPKMVALREALALIEKRVDEIDAAYEGSLAPAAAIKKTKTAAEEIGKALKVLKYTLREQAFADIWKEYVYRADEASGKNEDRRAAKELEETRQVIGDGLELVRGTEFKGWVTAVTAWEQDEQKAAPDQLKALNGEVTRRRTALHIRLQNVRGYLTSGHLLLSEKEQRELVHLADGIAKLRNRLAAPKLTPERVLLEAVAYKKQVKQLEPLVNAITLK